ncbi:hypothetical protein HMPREF9058_0831 [Actinomyces sp. oral taxon 175 str. F0384]|nr:hypothetical protein HMPREF9058_0831 [Actinomyces sp. oral taxon 175 str. F0384]
MSEVCGTMDRAAPPADDAMFHRVRGRVTTHVRQGAGS